MKQRNDCVAAIFEKHYIENGKFVYTFDHVVIGHYDEDNNIFMDRNGNEYFGINDKELFFSEIPKACANVVKICNLPKVLDVDEPYSKCIEYFNNWMSQILILNFLREDGNITSAILNTEDIRNSLGIGVNREKDEEAEDTTSEIQELVKRVIDGDFSLDELKEIRKEIKEGYDSIESLLDSLDLQIEASEKGESTTLLKGESEEDLEKRRQTKSEVQTKINQMRNAERVRPNNYIDIVSLLKKIKKTLIAQDEAAKRVIVEIVRKEQNPDLKNRAILLTGPTGVGKTKLMSLIAKNLDKPFYKIDATKLTIPGYVGTDLEEELWKLYLKCGKDKDKTEHAIVFIDEIDKKGSDNKSDVSGRGVLNVLLPFIEGAEYDICEDTKTSVNRVRINTNNMTIILGGAFSDVYNSLNKRTIGFNSEKSKQKDAETKDFVSIAGMPDEFMGRVAVVRLNELDVADIKKILLESDESNLKIQEKLFNELGVKLTSSDEFIEKIAQEAVKRKTGARGLNTIIEEATWQAYEDAYKNLGVYDEIVLTEETANDSSKYLVKRKKVEN